MTTYDFETLQDHDSLQEIYIQYRPICVCCGGRVLGSVLGVLCEDCKRRLGERED